MVEGTLVTLNVGGSTVIKVPFSSNPRPEIAWTLNGSRLPEDGHIRSETSDGLTSLILANVGRMDGGEYSLTLKNDYGQCSVYITVKVLGEE